MAMKTTIAAYSKPWLSCMVVAYASDPASASTSDTRPAAIHRRQNLHVANAMQAEPLRDTLGDRL